MDDNTFVHIEQSTHGVAVGGASRGGLCWDVTRARARRPRERKDDRGDFFVAAKAATTRRLIGFDLGTGKKFKSKRDPSSRKMLLWMTAKYGLADRTGI